MDLDLSEQEFSPWLPPLKLSEPIQSQIRIKPRSLKAVRATAHEKMFVKLTGHFVEMGLRVHREAARDLAIRNPSRETITGGLNSATHDKKSSRLGALSPPIGRLWDVALGIE